MTFPASLVWQRLDPTPNCEGGWEHFRHADQVRFLEELVRTSRVPLVMDVAGESAEGRSLPTLRFGTGRKRVLVWARQHGDEVDCTAALAMALKEILFRPDDVYTAGILANLDVLVLPMVNPDGVARYTRRSAQGIDLNRDAVAHVTPEGQTLVRVKDQHRAAVCFNLHDMDSRKTEGSGRQVALAFQACPPANDPIGARVFDEARRIIGRMVETAGEYAPGHLARYTTDFMPRAFGDNMAKWGLASVLIEAGGWAADKGGNDFVRRLFALSLLRGLYAVAHGEESSGDPGIYERIPFDSGKKIVDCILEGGEILDEGGRPFLRADIAFNRSIVGGAEPAHARVVSSIENLGDLADEPVLTRINVEGCVILPGLTAVAPEVTIGPEGLSREGARLYIEAGITTVACAAGPFASRDEATRWVDAAKAVTPPLNLVVFERVDSIDALRARHALTDFAGFVVPGMKIAASELARLLPPDERIASEGEVGVDLFLSRAAGASSTMLHLNLVSSPGGEYTKAVTAGELGALAAEFDAPSACIFTCSGGSLHDRTYIHHELFSPLPANGLWTLSRRADLVLFPRSGAHPGRVPSSAPRMVVLNGAIVLDESGLLDNASLDGCWHFSAGGVTS